MAYTLHMVIKETRLFTQIIQEVMADDEYRALQEVLVDNPKLGDVIRGSGGLRKVRWKVPGKGKRGGLRVIYYYFEQDEQLYMIFAYKKNEQSDLTVTQIKMLKKVIEEEPLK